jgi:3-deoxy-manno-octulosonate cytidylyltransferase (CMP-KDO synthetase)
MREITNIDDISNPNNVKVVVDQNNFALYFSRSIIPYPREENGVFAMQHIGIYACEKQALLDFYSLPDVIGGIRKLEQLRYLEFKRIKMIEKLLISELVHTLRI